MIQYFRIEGTGMADTEYITSKGAAETLGISTRRVVGLCNDGKLNGAVRTGRVWKIPRESVLAYQNSGRLSGSTARLLSCAVGNTSYMEVVRNSYYVDKTLLIRDLMDDHASVTLFTRPRRFGKTLAMDMLKTYFEKAEEDTSVYFRDKKIRESRMEQTAFSVFFWWQGT